jgi:hypothetical protein
MNKIVFASIVFLMTTTVAPAQNADFYTGSPDGIFRVDLTTGYTEQVATFDPPNMAGYLYDGYHGSLYAVSARPWGKPDPLDCGGGYRYANWIVNNYAQIQGWTIDMNTWTATPGGGTSIAGRYAEFEDSCDAPFMYVNCGADDPNSATHFDFFAPASPNNPSTPVTFGFYNPETGQGQNYNYGTWPEGTIGNPGTSDPATNPGWPIVYAAVNPLDGTVWCLSAYFSENLSQFDPVSLKVPVRFDARSMGKGPIAFDPAGNLWRYDYDSDGNAWLNQIDLTTGNVVQISAKFWAPAESMFFIPKP